MVIKSVHAKEGNYSLERVPCILSSINHSQTYITICGVQCSLSFCKRCRCLNRIRTFIHIADTSDSTWMNTDSQFQFKFLQFQLSLAYWNTISVIQNESRLAVMRRTMRWCHRQRTNEKKNIPNIFMWHSPFIAVDVVVYGVGATNTRLLRFAATDWVGKAQKERWSHFGHLHSTLLIPSLHG